MTQVYYNLKKRSIISFDIAFDIESSFQNVEKGLCGICELQTDAFNDDESCI